MMMRHKKEMLALLARVKEQLGPLEKWSEDALMQLDKWASDLRSEIGNEGVVRDERPDYSD
ncbi:MAG TPA: hypothetical protein VF816_00455 [Rhodocyclaceae bacterium]